MLLRSEAKQLLGRRQPGSWPKETLDEGLRGSWLALYRQVGFVPAFRKRHRHFGISVTWMLSILSRPDLLQADLCPMWLSVAQLPRARHPGASVFSVLRTRRALVFDSFALPLISPLSLQASKLTRHLRPQRETRPAPMRYECRQRRAEADNGLV